MWKLPLQNCDGGMRGNCDRGMTSVWSQQKPTVQTWKIQENLLCGHRLSNKWWWGSSYAKPSCQCVKKGLEISSCFWCRFWTQGRMWINILKRHINIQNRWKWNYKNVCSFLLVDPGLDSGNWTMKEEVDRRSWLSSSTQILVNKVSNCNIVDIFMQILVCLSRELRDHLKHVFRWLHRNIVEKDSSALLDRTRIHWNIATQSVQSKDFVFSKANRRDHIPLGSQYTSASSTVFIFGWSKGIHCPWTGVFVAESPARYTKHFKYLSRCLLEAMPPMSAGNLIPYLMKSKLRIFTISEKCCISLRFSCWVAAFPEDLLFFLHQLNFMVMPFHKILI